MKSKERTDDAFRAAINHRRAVEKITVQELADDAKCSKRYVQGVLSNKEKRSPSRAISVRIATALDHSYEEMLDLGRWILEERDPMKWPGVNRANLDIKAPKPEMNSTGTTEGTPPEPSNVSPAPKAGTPRHVPMISWVQAGDWHDAEDPFPPGQADEWTITTETDSPNAFALTVQGDSMEPVFFENDIIIVDPDVVPVNGKYIIAKNGDEATFKKLVIDGENVFLKPENERYPIKDMTGVDFVIVGVVVEKRRSFR